MARPHNTDARLDTIRGLLAKAEATTFPAEAEAFVAKATELMARYAIDEAMLWAEGGDDREEPAEIQIVLLRPFTGQKALLVAGVAEAFGCMAIRLGGRQGAAQERISVVGYPADLTLVETLITSLFVQLTTAMTADTSAPRNATASQVAGWRRSFIAGFADIVIGRIKESQAAARREADERRHADAGAPTPPASDNASVPPQPPQPSTDLVLVERHHEVRSDFRRRYPHVRSSRVSTGTSVTGKRAGQHAGRRADIGNRRVGGNRALPEG